MLKEIKIKDKKNNLIKGFIDFQRAPFLSDNDFLSSGLSLFMKILKDDKKITIGMVDKKITGFPYSLLVKKFKFKNNINFLLRTLINDKAEKLFYNHELLSEKGFPVPLSFGFINYHKQGESVFISEFIENSSSFAELCKITPPETVYVKFLPLVAENLLKLHKSGITHGDIKWVNILFDKNCKMFFIDLDQVKFHKRVNIKGINKDLTRFHRFALESEKEIYSKKIFLPLYYSLCPEEIKKHIDTERIMAEAFRNWQKKGFRKF